VPLVDCLLAVKHLKSGVVHSPWSFGCWFLNFRDLVSRRLCRLSRFLIAAWARCLASPMLLLLFLQMLFVVLVVLLCRPYFLSALLSGIWGLPTPVNVHCF
jgi:hypothetical protein